MSYNDPTTAKALVGATLTSEQLEVGTSIINNWTDYRWTATTEVRQFSGNGKCFYYVFNPITTWTSLIEIDEENETETTLTRYSDYDVDYRTGRIQNFLGFVGPQTVGNQRYYPQSGYIPHIPFTTGHNNYQASYTYGYDADNKYFALVRYAEAALALLIKKNPLMMGKITLTGGDKMDFDKADPVYQIIQQIPRSINMVGI